MHYYKLNIAGWNLGAGHLSLEEEAIYFRLVNHYYKTESPISIETQSVFRKLKILEQAETALAILGEFFELTEDGWRHEKCEKLLQEYHEMALKNRENGAKGGRPPKNKGLDDNPVGSPRKPTGNPDETQTKPKHNTNQEPLTKNHKPITNNKDLSTKADDSLELQIYNHWKTTMGKNGSTKFTDGRRSKIKARLREGYTIDQIKTAIDNCKASEFHMGGNENKTVYNDITLICREGSKLEQFMDNLSTPENDGPRDLSHLDEFLDPEYRT